jgi:hypothetical protein
MKTRNRTCSTEDQCRHLGVNVQHEECKRAVDNDDDGRYKSIAKKKGSF